MTPELTVHPQKAPNAPTASPPLPLSAEASNLKAALRYIMAVHELLDWAPLDVVPRREGI